MRYIGVVCGVVLLMSNANMAVYAEDSSVDEGGDSVEAVEINEDIPEVYIKAINPGYTVDGKSNTGEMIEIARKNVDEPLELSGMKVGYTNSSGNYTVLVEFPENSWMRGKSIVLRLASAPESERAAVNYTKTIAMSAGLDLKKGEEVLDEVCWTGKNECYKEFKSASPTTLVRNLATGEFEHMAEYQPEYDVESYFVEVAKEEEGYGKAASQCKGLIFSEILSYYETSKTEQFIELHNTRAEQILLNGCQIRYKNKNYMLEGIVGADGYYVYYPSKFSLTKNPVTSNTLELIDTDGETIDKLVYPNGQRKGTAYAWIGYDAKGEEIWKTTYAPTPGAANNYQEYRTCESGKVINEATGNCVKVASVSEKICKEGQYLNILTGRCKKYETSAEKTCKEGYYLNPATNRCRKIVENNGADYSLAPETYEEQSSFVALYAVLGVVGVGAGYLIYEFRHEIKSGATKVWRKLTKKAGK